MAECVAPYDEEHPENAPTKGAQTLDDLQDKPFIWDTTAPLGFSYAPSLIKVSAHDPGKTITFSFIRCDGTTSLPYTITMPNPAFVHHLRPSVLPTATDLQQGRDIGVILLNSKLSPDPELTSDMAKFSPPVQGKWPRSADIDARIVDLTARLFAAVKANPPVSSGARQDLTLLESEFKALLAEASA